MLKISVPTLEHTVFSLALLLPRRPAAECCKLNLKTNSEDNHEKDEIHEKIEQQ